jgi:hypothetical protein
MRFHRFTGRLAAEVMDADVKFVTYDTTPAKLKVKEISTKFR